MKRLNQRHLAHSPDDSELSARIESFELAYRMQMAAPECLDLEKESRADRKPLRTRQSRAMHVGKQCLIARRLVERGVRFVQIYSGGMENERSWDGHQNIVQNHAGFAAEVDLPIAGLLTDLESRGLLDSTLVLCCGEFGRLPIVQKGGTGRDHNPHAFTTWMAGGGVKGGVSYGQTDEIGFKAVVNKVGVHDLHATVLHLLGIEHTRSPTATAAATFASPTSKGPSSTTFLPDHNLPASANFLCPMTCILAAPATDPEHPWTLRRDMSRIDPVEWGERKTRQNVLETSMQRLRDWRRLVRACVSLVISAAILGTLAGRVRGAEPKWVSLFDGKSLKGWTGNTDFWPSRKAPLPARPPRGTW